MEKYESHSKRVIGVTSQLTIQTQTHTHTHTQSGTHGYSTHTWHTAGCVCPARWRDISTRLSLRQCLSAARASLARIRIIDPPRTTMWPLHTKINASSLANQLRFELAAAAFICVTHERTMELGVWMVVNWSGVVGRYMWQAMECMMQTKVWCRFSGSPTCTTTLTLRQLPTDRRYFLFTDWCAHHLRQSYKNVHY